MTQKIFQAFVVIMASAILFLIPLTTAAYDFQTDLREDTFTVNTAVGVTSANVTLVEEVYDDDVTTISVSSDLSTDEPLYSSYNTTTRQTLFTGLTANTTRTLTVGYDVDALEGGDAINTVADRLAWFWLISIIVFAPAALAAIFIGRRE